MNSPILKSILLIDDDEISNLFNKIFISKLKLEADVNIVLNGQEALDMITSYEDNNHDLLPCLLLLDLKMPVMNGWQFLKAYESQVAKNIKDNVIIVVLTTSADEEDNIRAIKNPNVKEFIQKPLSDGIFRELISKYFGNTKVT